MSKHFFITLKVVTVCFLLFVFSYKTVTFIDPDLGWHIRSGEAAVANGWHPLTADIWTYTMTGHRFVDHEWLPGAFFLLASEHGHWPLVEAVFVLLGFIPLVVWIIRAQSGLELGLISISATILLNIAGIRPQVITIFLFFLLFEYLQTIARTGNQKLLFALPVFFILWANLHGGFPVGFLLWGAFLVGKHWDNPRNNRALLAEWLLLVASVALTLLNPYGILLWKEIIDTTFSPMMAYISEWASVFSWWDLSFPFIFGISFPFFLYYRKKFSIGEQIALIGFFLLGIIHLRMMPFFLTVYAPLLGRAVPDFFEVIAKKNPQISPRFFRSMTCLGVFMVFVGLWNTLRGPVVTEPYHPPLGAIAVLYDQILPKTGGFIYNHYNFGGGMIGASTTVPVFADGRLPHWKNSDGFSAFATQLVMEQDHSGALSLFERYDIRIVFTSASYFGTRTGSEKAIDRYIPRVLLPTVRSVRNWVLPGVGGDSLASFLLRRGWCRVYLDSIAGILVKPGTPLCLKRGTARQ